MRKIPTFFGLVLIVGLVGVLALSTNAVRQVTSIFSRANSGSTIILPVGVANVTDTAFTVYWITSNSNKGAVLYGQTKSLGDGTVLDDKDSTSHFVQVTGLKSNTKYFFRIGGDTTSDPTDVTTLSSTPKALEPIFGKVLDMTNQTVEGAVVVWQNKTAALSQADGSFALPVYDISAGQPEKIVISSATGTATVDCTYGQDRPLPAVKLGENVSCNNVNNNTTTSNGFTVPQGTNPSNAVGGQLQVNLQNDQTVSTPLPTISGKAGPNQTVNIVVHSAVPYSGTVKADRDGNWTWTPPAGLTPGDHTATITITNPDGTTQTVTRRFTVVSGEPILPITSGTPSASITHKTCLNYACVDISGAGTDSCVADADCPPPPPPPPPPISTPSAVPVIPPTPTPVTGAFENTIILIVGGFALLALGVGLIL